MRRTALDADVLILAAGLGTRLRPLTTDTPKPLVEVGGRRLIDFSLDLARRSGAVRVFINLHYQADKIRRYVGDGTAWGLQVEYSDEPVILDTGGAVKNIENRLQQDVLLTLNADTIVGPEFSLAPLLAEHRRQKLRQPLTIVTRAITSAGEYTPLAVDASGRLLGLGTSAAAAAAHEQRVFCGIQAVSREVLDYMPAAGSPFSMSHDTWLKLLAADRNIVCYDYGGYWADIATVQKLNEASPYVAKIFSIP